jgi:hypothetical protein
MVNPEPLYYADSGTKDASKESSLDSVKIETDGDGDKDQALFERRTMFGNFRPLRLYD